jgi:hypothetical protein
MQLVDSQSDEMRPEYRREDFDHMERGKYAKRARATSNATETSPKRINMDGDKTVTSEERQELLDKLQARFEENANRHKGLEWAKIQARLEADTEKLWSLQQMEATGGEPDVTGFDKKTGEYVFVDCSAESPDGRRNVCFDREALDSRKKNKPETSAIEMAAAMGVELLAEDQYRALQELGEFDAKTSSWLVTPPSIRERGGAIFGDRRYDHVFVYHNGADSYYAARGFRASLRV